MAGDWIKMRVALAYDLKVMQIARTLNGDHMFLDNLAPGCQVPKGGCNASALHTYVIGALHRFWCAAQEVTQNGKLGQLEANDIDCLVGCPGFSDALIEVGWLEVDESTGLLQVHNWEEHNGESAKKRAAATKRVQKHREGVTQKRYTSPEACNAKTLPEKRREEKSIKENSPTGSKRKAAFAAPSLDDVREYIQQRGSQVDPVAFHAFYEANGWLQGRGKPIKDWRQCVITWERREVSNGKAQPLKIREDF